MNSSLYVGFRISSVFEDSVNFFPVKYVYLHIFSAMRKMYEIFDFCVKFIRELLLTILSFDFRCEKKKTKICRKLRDIIRKECFEVSQPKWIVLDLVWRLEHGV